MPLASNRYFTSLVLLICSLGGVAFGVFYGPGLNEPAAIGPYLNGVFPAKVSGDIAATSTEERANTGLGLAPEPRGTRMFVAEQRGAIYTFAPGDDGLSGKQLFMDIGSKVWAGQDSGVLGFAFHPDYNLDGSPNSTYFYVFYTALKNEAQYLRLSRFSGNDTNSELVMFEQDLGEPLHRGGGLVFGDDGFLYLAIGDLGFTEQAQNITERLAGGVIRIDVDQQGGSVSHPPRRMLEDTGHGFSGVGYYIPSDNPFLDTEGGVFEEYYSIGSRNPHRMTKDRATGIMYIGNVGSNSGDIREEVNVLAKGANFGWPFREGTVDRPDLMPRPDPVIGTVTDPIHEYTHTSGDGCSVIGGYVYRGSLFPELSGQYIFTDYCSKKVWAMDVSSAPVTEKQELISVDLNPVTFGEDAAGELYIAVQGWHPVYKLTAAAANEGPAIPALLSQTGVFSDLSTLTPTAGVIPYTVNAPLWSDAAVKQRWLAIPNDGTHDTAAEQIGYLEEGEWSFPVGTVFIKHFELALNENNPSDLRRLETRFLIHGEDSYYALTYRWNEAGTDADLLESSLVEPLTITEVGGGMRQQDWYYPSRSDCFVCHTSASGRVLGPNARQLNGDLYYPNTGLAGNQLESLNEIGAFDHNIDVAGLSGILTSRNLADESASLEVRARSYLDANCAGCHQPGGGPRSTFDLRLYTDMADNGLVNGEVIENLGIEGAKVIVPGDPDKSVLYQRIAQVGTATAMPPLAKNRLDEPAVALIRDWIMEMEALPVELVRFEGHLAQDNIRLVWETASETNNAGFAIERRARQATIAAYDTWVQIGFVEGLGTTASRQSYGFLDSSLPKEAVQLQYRLKQVDFDGAFKYSEWITLDTASPDELVLHKNYPNPFNPTTSIRYELPVDGEVKLAIYDTQGREVRTIVDGFQTVGRYETFFDGSGLASGVYLYRLEIGSRVQVRKMLLIK